MARMHSFAVTTALLAAAPVAAQAAETRGPAEAPVKPMRRLAPERNMVELGVFGGVFVANRYHDFYNPATAPQEPLRRPTADLGVRAAFFPLRFFGIEAEFSALPGARYDGGGAAFLYGVRGHGILQLPWFRLTPFILGGYGLMGVSSSAAVAGEDVDPIGHVGGGVKYFIHRRVAVRLDLRNFIGAQAAEQTDGAGHFQALLGVSVTLNRSKPRPKPAAAPDPDRDRDGFLDDVDRCPDDPGIAPHGCPDRDSDGDGFLDSVDACPAVPGVAPDGCPPKDRDRDGFLDEVDACPEEPGVAPDGCPLRDRDGDGILDKDDRCVDVPENRNGFEDTDGCPDEIPQAIARFTGVIRGIYFDFGKNTIRKKSAPTLDQAAKIFKDFPDIKVEISGHTDDVGKREYNVDLSQRRAESVRRYLVDRGVAPERIKTRGAGPDEPIADNKTAPGRAKNRRIEFKMIVD
jgi:OOP family OmpA-OmpF porin